MCSIGDRRARMLTWNEQWTENKITKRILRDGIRNSMSWFYFCRTPNGLGWIKACHVHVVTTSTTTIDPSIAHNCHIVHTFIAMCEFFLFCSLFSCRRRKWNELIHVSMPFAFLSPTKFYLHANTPIDGYSVLNSSTYINNFQFEFLHCSIGR